MPPADPWMVGKTINYYYWGYLLAAAQTKLAGLPPLLPTVPPMVAYNLAVATFPGFAFTAAACLGFRLSRGRLGVGLAAAGATVFAGNVVGALDTWAAPFSKEFDYWHASRVIANGNTINEFPFFTFFHADLHPHLLAFPYFIAAFVLAHRWVERGPKLGPGRGGWTSLASKFGGELLLALVAGTAWAASLWNAPAIAILLLVSGFFFLVQGRRLPTLRQALIGTADRSSRSRRCVRPLPRVLRCRSTWRTRASAGRISSPAGSRCSASGERCSPSSRWRCGPRRTNRRRRPGGAGTSCSRWPRAPDFWWASP